MKDVRHMTASAVVLDQADRVLLVHHIRAGLWLYPGGHVDANEDPAQAAIREVFEETGIKVAVVGRERFRHASVDTLPSPFAILEMSVADARNGAHRHIDMVLYANRARASLRWLLAKSINVSGLLSTRWAHDRSRPN